MDLLMKFEAMMKIRMAGARARERKERTSLALKREPMPCCRRSNQSFTRLRKSRTSRSRKTIRLGLKRAKSTMLDATGTSGVAIPRSNTLTALSMSRKPAMMRRLRLRRLCSLRSGMATPGPTRPNWPRGRVGSRVGCIEMAVASLNSRQGVVVGLAGGLLGGAGHAGEPRVLTVQRGVGVDANVEDL